MPVASVFIAISIYYFINNEIGFCSLFSKGSLIPRLISVLCMGLMVSYPFFSMYRIRHFYKLSNTKNLYQAAQQFFELVPTKVPIVVLDDGGRFPEFFYFSHKKGWHLGNALEENSTRIERVKECIKIGAKYVAIVFSRKRAEINFSNFLDQNSLAQYLLTHYRPILQGKSYIIFGDIS